MPRLRKVFLALQFRQAHGVLLAGGNSSAVERQPSKLGVAGSNPVSRSSFASSVLSQGRAPGVPREAGNEVARQDESSVVVNTSGAHVAQLAEHALGKGEVSGSIPDMGSIPNVTRAKRERR